MTQLGIGFPSGTTLEFPNGARAIVLDKCLTVDAYRCRWQRVTPPLVAGDEFELDTDTAHQYCARLEAAP